MARLYKRQIEILIGNRLYSEHEIQFDASLSLSSDPDEAVVKIYNLSSDARGAAETADRSKQVVIRAGYQGSDLPNIFVGRWRSAKTTREGPHLITEIEAASALQAREYGRQLNRTYRAGTRVGAIVRDLLLTLEVGEGTLANQIDTLQLTGVGGQLNAPVSISGPAWPALVEILESNGLRVTTQGDEIVAVGVNDALSRTAIVLSETSGLRGVPSVDKEGIVTASAAMIPGIVPGRLVQIRSELLRCQCRVNKCTYRGSLYGQDFGVTLEGRQT